MAEVVPAPHPTTCEACGTPLGLRYWIVDYPRAVHHECRDWSAVRWPFEHVEHALRRALRSADREGGTPLAPAMRLACERLLVDLRDARRAWPNGTRNRETYDALEPRCRRALALIEKR